MEHPDETTLSHLRTQNGISVSINLLYYYSVLLSTFQVFCTFLYCGTVFRTKRIRLDRPPPDVFPFHIDHRLKCLEDKIEEEVNLFCDEVPEDFVLRFKLVSSKDKPLYIFVVPYSTSFSLAPMDTILKLFDVHVETTHIAPCNAHDHSHYLPYFYDNRVNPPC